MVIQGSTVKAYFENSSAHCPIIAYSLVKNTQGQPLDASSNFVALDNQSAQMTISNNMDQEGEHVLYVQATTAGKVSAYQKLTVAFKFYDNSPPVFSSPVQDQVISIKEWENNDSIFTYQSPVATDAEGDQIVFVFFYNFPCKCVSIDAKTNYFVVNVDESKLTAADDGEWLVSI